jgi:predicted transcriptional regulator
MVRKPQDVTDAELAILKSLWDTAPATVRQLADALYDGTESDYATVKKLLARLETKGFVRRNRASTAHAFEPTISHDELVGRRLQGLADNLCDGSRTPLLMHLLRTDKLSAAERRELRALVDELDRDSSKPKKGRDR